jgi:hypothetical protein
MPPVTAQKGPNHQEMLGKPALFAQLGQKARIFKVWSQKDLEILSKKSGP